MLGFISFWLNKGCLLFWFKVHQPQSQACLPVSMDLICQEKSENVLNNFVESLLYVQHADI